MAEPLSWIRLNRNITSWRHWKNHRVAIVFIWLLAKAQYGEESYIGSTKINRGEVATSIDRIAEENGITYQQVRDDLNTLKKTGEISTRKGQRFVIIKIENYEKYQPVEVSSEQTDNKQITNRNQTKNTLRTNQKQHYKKVKKDIREESKEISSAPLPYPCGVAVKPKWRDDDEWEKAKYMTADDIPGIHRGFYDDVIEYLRDKKEGRLK